MHCILYLSFYKLSMSYAVYGIHLTAVCSAPRVMYLHSKVTQTQTNPLRIINI